MKIIYLLLIISIIFIHVKAENNRIIDEEEVVINSRRVLADEAIKYSIKICGTRPEKPTETTTTPEATTTTIATTKPEVTTTDDEILISSSAATTRTDDEQETPTEDEKENKQRILAERKDFDMTDKTELGNIIKSILTELYPEGVTVKQVDIPTIEEPYSLTINITLVNSNDDNKVKIEDLNLNISSNNNDDFYNKLNEATNNIYSKCRLEETTTCKYDKQSYKFITKNVGSRKITPTFGSKLIEGSCTNTITSMDPDTGKISVILSKEFSSYCKIQCRDYLKNDGYGVVSIKVISEDKVEKGPVFDKISYPVMVYVNEPFNTTLTLKYPDIIDDSEEEEEEEKVNKNNNKNENENEELTIEMVINDNDNSNFTMNEQESTGIEEFKFNNANITIKENTEITIEKEIELAYRNVSNEHIFHNVIVKVLSQPCPNPDDMGVCCVHKPGELCSNLTLSFSFVSFTTSRLLAAVAVADSSSDVEFRNEFKEALDVNVFTPQDCVATDKSEGTTLNDPLILSVKKNAPSESGDGDNDSGNKPTKIITLEEAFKGIITSIEKIQNNEIPEVAKVLTENNIILDPDQPITYSQVISNTELPTFEPNPVKTGGENNNWAKDNWYVILIIVIVILLLIVGGVFGSLFIIKKRKNNNNNSLPTNFNSVVDGNIDNNNNNDKKKSKNKNKYQVNDKQVNEKHQSIEDIEPEGDNVVGKVSIDINNNSYNNNYVDEDDENTNSNKPIKFEGYLEKELPERTTDKWILRYCVLYANPSILYVYESMKPSYKGNIFTGVKQIIPLDSVKTIKYDKKQSKQLYDFTIIMLDNDQQVQSNECMEDLKYVHLKIPAADYPTTVNSFNEWINYLTADEKPSLIKDAWGGDYVSDNGEDEEQQQQQQQVDDSGDVKIDFNDDDDDGNNRQENEEEDHQQQEHRLQTPPQPPPRQLPPSPSSPPTPPPRALNESPDKVSLPVGRVKAHRDIGLRDEP